MNLEHLLSPETVAWLHMLAGWLWATVKFLAWWLALGTVAACFVVRWMRKRTEEQQRAEETAAAVERSFEWHRKENARRNGVPCESERMVPRFDRPPPPRNPPEAM